MGLDSVELIIRVEGHFDIAIPDKEAAQIETVQELADCAYAKVLADPTPKCRSQILFYKLRSYFVDNGGWKKNDLPPDIKVSDLITKDLKETWADIERYLELDLPELSELDFDPEREKGVKIFGVKLGTKKSPVTIGTLGDLVHWALAKNHEKLIDPLRLFNKSDVEKIVIGIVSESSGIPVNEIKLEHRICYDLGID
jgi:hypothetical protein